MSAARLTLLLLLLAPVLLTACSLAVATVAVGSAAVSVATSAVGVASDVAVGTVKGAAKVTGAVIDAASGSGKDKKDEAGSGTQSEVPPPAAAPPN
jgi:hypothetical protein